MKRRILPAAAIVALALALILAARAPRPAPVGFDGAVFSPLDSLGRAGVALAMLSPATLDAGRDDISRIEPSGWQSVPTEDVPGGRLFNRCHLVAAMLAKGTEVPENLVTGTRQLNEAMLRVESAVADHIRRTGGHVLYRVEPVFEGDEPICRAVRLRAWSVETDALRVDVEIPNVQDGAAIDYAGDNAPADDGASGDYVLNLRSRRFHLPDCPGVKDIAPHNRRDYRGARADLLAEGYRPCGYCDP